MADVPRRQMARWIERSWVYMTWKLSTAKGETMEMQMDFPNVPATTGDIVNAVSRKRNVWTSQTQWRMTAKGTKPVMRFIAVKTT